jgi:hypothetical protein
MLKIPDIIGFNLRDAVEVLKNKNIGIDTIEITSAPRLKCQEYDDTARVLRILLAEDNKVKLLICKPL